MVTAAMAGVLMEKHANPIESRNKMRLRAVTA
jgi:hypothetical protein